MANPVPSTQQQLAQLEHVHAYTWAIADSEVKTAIRSVIRERIAQILAGYDAEHDVKHGIDHLLREAVRRITTPSGFDIPWKSRVEAAALIIASLELEAYRAEGEDA